MVLLQVILLSKQNIYQYIYQQQNMPVGDMVNRSISVVLLIVYGEEHEFRCNSS